MRFRDIGGARQMYFHREKARDRVFSGVGVDDLGFSESLLEDCTFEGFNLETAGFGGLRRQTVFRRCRFVGLRLAHTVVGKPRFEDCRFEEVDIRHWMSFYAEYLRCTFTGKLRDGVINGTFHDLYERTGRHFNEVADNDFSACEFRAFGFRGGVDLTRQRLPTRPGYLWIPDFASAVEVVDAGVGELPASAREYATKFIAMGRDELTTGQRQKFFDLTTWHWDEGDARPFLDLVVRAGSIVT